MSHPASPPLIDRHTHLEGAQDPVWVRAEALRRGLTVPPSLIGLWEGTAAPFEGFIEAFLFGAALLDSRSAVREAALASDVTPHPLPRMLAAGVRCALGTDDPGVIPCDLTTESAAARAMGLDDDALATLRRNGAEDAWCLS